MQRTCGFDQVPNDCSLGQQQRRLVEPLHPARCIHPTPQRHTIHRHAISHITSFNTRQTELASVDIVRSLS